MNYVTVCADPLDYSHVLHRFRSDPNQLKLSTMGSPQCNNAIGSCEEGAGLVEKQSVMTLSAPTTAPIDQCSDQFINRS